MSDFPGLSTHSHGSALVLAVEDDNVDFRNCETIKTAIKTLVGGGQTHIILDLGKVAFMDSSGLSVLLVGKRSCEEAGGSFALCGLQQYVNNLVTLTNLNKSITIYENATQAPGS